MPRVENIPELAFNPYGQGYQAPPEEPTWGNLFAAGFRQENPVVAAIGYFNQPEFEADPNFDIMAAGEKDQDLFYNYSKEFAVAKSQAEYDNIRARILQEEADRQTLAAGGFSGFAVAAAAGILSPTTLIPGMGPARGIKGVAQALSLAAVASSIDELTLLETQLTRTGGEAALGIATGTVLGGLLGTAARYATPVERVGIERGMALSSDERAILYSTGDGSRMASRTGHAAEELADLTPEQRAAIRAVEPEGSIGAKATSDVPTRGFETPNMVARYLVDKLGKLNPVTRTVNQTYSRTARQAALRMSDAGLQTAGNKEFIPHAEGGILEARAKEFNAFEARFIQELDDAFSRHILGDKLPTEQLQKARLATVKSALGRLPEGKMDNETFNKEVFRVAQTGEVHPDPYVNQAAKSWEKFADKVKEYAEEAFEYRQTVEPNARRLFDPEGNLGPDAEKWVTHVFSPEAIAQNYDQFLKDLAENATGNSQGTFKRAFEKFKKKQDALKAELRLREMDPQEATQTYAYNESQLEAIAEIPVYRDWYEQGLELARQRREAKRLGDEEQELLLKEAQKAHKEEVSDELRELIALDKQLRAENKILNQNIGRMNEQAEELAQKIEELDVQDQNALAKVSEAGVKLGIKMNKLEGKMDAEAKRLWKNLTAALKGVDTQKQLMEKVYKGKPLEGKAAFDAYQRMSLLSKRRDAADAKANELIAKIEGNENFDWQETYDLLRAVQDLNNIRTLELNRKRAIRAEKLQEKIEDIDPEKVKKVNEELRQRIYTREEAFDTKWRERGAEDLNIETGYADFTRYGREVAEELAEKIMGLHNPIAGLEILGGKRGPELARVLNLPLEIKSKYLETDMEKLSRVYTRRIAPDIEMYRAFGSVNAAPVFDRVRLEFRNLRERLGSSELRPASKKNYERFIKGEELLDAEREKFIPWEEADKKQALSDLLAAQKQVETDLRVMVTRFRHQRGLPDDPRGVGYRLGRIANDINVMRFMGSVVPSSFADVARPVMRYGAYKTLRHGYLPFVTNLKRVKMSREAARRLGVALDPIMHNRTQAVFDMWEDYASRKTVPERVTGFLSNKTGLVAMFDRWTAEMKQVTASITMTEISDAVEAVAQGTAKAKQTAMLAEMGINDNLAKRIYSQLTSVDGGDRVDGVLLPNTESWTDLQAKRAYAAAVNKTVDDLIVTPGLDRPNWVDQNMAFKVLAQFRSFMFTSTNRTVLRGAQQPDMALLEGVTFALALGMLSYYTWAVSRGGDSLTEANEASFGKWADEAIARSGLLGIFQEAWEIAQKIPGLSDKVTFSGEGTTQRRTLGLAGRVFGPSVDLVDKISQVILGMDEPTQATIHQARLLAPYQNVFYLRQFFDQIEDTFNSVAQIPESRK